MSAITSPLPLSNAVQAQTINADEAAMHQLRT